MSAGIIRERRRYVGLRPDAGHPTLLEGEIEVTARIVMGLHHTPCRIVGEMDGRPTGAASAREQSAVIVFEEHSTSEAIKDGKAAPLGVEAIADAGRRHVDVPVVLARKRISPAQQVGKPPLGRTEEYLGMPVLHADDRPIELHGERDGEGVRPAHPQRRRPATMGVVEQAQRHARSAVKRKVVIGIDEVARRKVDRVAPVRAAVPALAHQCHDDDGHEASGRCDGTQPLRSIRILADKVERHPREVRARQVICAGRGAVAHRLHGCRGLAEHVHLCRRGGID